MGRRNKDRQLTIRYVCPLCSGPHPRSECPSENGGKQPQRPVPTRREIEKAAPTRAQLAAWGVPWPPPRGWRKRLLRAADQAHGSSAAEQQPTTGPRVGPYRVGERHRCWPEWTWDVSGFVPSASYQPTMARAAACRPEYDEARGQQREGAANKAAQSTARRAR